MVSVYAIVVTYNGSEWIESCFGSLSNSLLPLNIVAVDNGSSDDTPNQIRESFPQVEVIETGKNLGFGKANNLGLQIAKGKNADYIFLLNQDAWIEKDTIQGLVNIAAENPEYGILSPVHLNNSGDDIDVAFKKYLRDDVTPNLIADIYLGKYKSVYETKFVNATAWLITKKTLRIVGGFDPLFFHLGEDNDYLNRMVRKSLKAGIVPEYKVFHFRSMKYDKRQFDSNRLRSKAINILKSDNPPTRFQIFKYFLLVAFNHFILNFGSNTVSKKRFFMQLFCLKLYKEASKHLALERTKIDYLYI